MLDLLENKLPEGSAVLDFVLLNSAMLIYTGGKANTFIEGVIMPRESLKSGKALKCFQYFLDGTKRLAE
jgi:anthranilate phosphoribosyltransferase